MANLTAVFELVDRISDKLDAIANKGSAVVDGFETMGNAADAAIGEATSAVDGVATVVSDYSQIVEGAAGTTDYWTDAVGNYSKSALEAAYSTEELVEMGMKSADALAEEQSVMELAKMATDDLNEALSASVSVHDECSEAMQRAAEMSEMIADSDKISEQAKVALQEATESASAAFEELAAAQQAAQAAMDNYNAVAESGTATITELEAAALNAATAADKLVEANEKAASATDDLSKATDNAAQEADKSGQKGVEAIEGIAEALAGAGITAKVKEIADAAYDLVDAFSEAESTVVLATGATGDALDGLTDSMMKAYAASKTGSLDDTAAAVGEINTRLGYTGDELTQATGMFLDFAAVTGGNASSSVKSLTQLMNQWNISADDLGVVMDKLTYAGQASGISVDALSTQLINNKAILDQLGFSMDEATAMFMNFELAGTNTTQVMTGFRAALSSGAISSLDELYDILEQVTSGQISAAEASEIFGSKAGPAIVNAANSGVFALDGVVASLENAGGTMNTTANAAQTLDQKWEQANNNVSAAFTNALAPAVNKLSSGFADLVNGIGDFLNKHPAVVKGISAAAAVIGVAVAAFGAYTVVQGIATAATALFGTTLSVAIWPLTLIVGAVAAVVGIVVALTSAFKDAEDETVGMTAVTRQQYYELQDLNAEYERACETYGENSEEALRLKYQVDDLSEAFENNRQTLEEFQAEVDDLCNSVHELSDGFNSSITEINANETSTLALIQKYEDLSKKAELTAGEQKQLEAVTNSLAESFPDLANRIENATISTEDYVEAMKKAAQAEAEAQRQQEAQETYIEALKKQAELEEEREKALANYNAELEAHDMVLNEVTGKYENGWYTADSPWASWTTDLDEYKDALDSVDASIAENDALLAQIEQGWEVTAEKEKEAAEAVVSYEDAVSEALNSVKGDIDELCAAYDEAYESARSSIDGQIGLFDTMATETETSVADMQAAFASQLEYLQTYTENLKLAAEYGIDEGLIASLSDGSEESAGYINTIVQNVQNLGEGTEAAKEFVDSFNTSFQEVETAKDQFATTVAKMETDFDEEMAKIEGRLDEAIENMNMEEDAAAAAKETMSAYTQSIIDGTANAVSAAESAAAAVSAALSTTQVTAGTNKVAGHAKGTTNAEDVFIAGEDGPELIVGAGGSTVFPHSETEQIIDEMSRPQEAVTVVNEYSEPTGFFDRVENVFTKMFSKLIGAFDKLAGNETKTVDLEAYATGTTKSEDAFIAGENGPELIIGRPDSEVFPTGETDRLIDAITALNIQPLTESVDNSIVYGNEVTNQYEASYDYSRAINESVGDKIDERVYSYDYSTTVDNSVGDSTEIIGTGSSMEVPELFVPVGDTGSVIEDSGTNKDANTRKILLEIAGKGNIELTGGKVDKETLLSFLYEYLKPVLSEILSQEIYEEGDLSYEY